MTDALKVESLESQWVLGLLLPKSIPDIAQDALVNGNDSDTLLELAICTPDESELIERLFRRYLIENGGGVMSKQVALRQYAKDVSKAILAQKIPAYDGARLIWKSALSAREKDFHELDTFIYAAGVRSSRIAY